MLMHKYNYLHSLLTKYYIIPLPLYIMDFLQYNRTFTFLKVTQVFQTKHDPQENILPLLSHATV